MIGIEQHGAVATITVDDLSPLSRADVGFALALRDAVRDTADSDTVKAIVLRSTARDFVPPADADDLAAAAAVRDAARAAWHAAYCASSGLWQNLAYCKKSIVTAVHGHCGAAGSMLVLCTDHTVCAEDSRFDAPFATMPDSSLVLAALTMRLNRAKSWMLGGAPLAAADALRCGLVNRVLAHDRVATAADAAAREAARMPLDGVAMTRLLLEALMDTQGVGQDFDMAGFYADSLASAQRAAGARR